MGQSAWCWSRFCTTPTPARRSRFWSVLATLIGGVWRVALAAGWRPRIAARHCDLGRLLPARHSQSHVRGAVLDAQRAVTRGRIRSTIRHCLRQPDAGGRPHRNRGCTDRGWRSGMRVARREPVHPADADHADPRQRVGSPHVLVGGRHPGLVAADHVWRARCAFSAQAFTT